MSRFNDAVFIQEGGACNPSGIARALVAACDEARADGVQQREDPAVRLIVHQLAFLCCTEEIDRNNTYDQLMTACKEKAA